MRLALPYRGRVLEVLAEICTYENRNMAIRLYTKGQWGFEPWSNLTVNVGACARNCACIDVNNNGQGILDWISANELASPTGRVVRSGYVEYPEYRFDAAALRVLDREGYEDYCRRVNEEEQEAS